MFHIASISLSYILQTCPWPWSNILGNFMFVSCSPVCEYIYTYLDSPAPHNFRSLWIFGCGPNNHLWAKSDGFNDTVLVSKSRSFASFLRHLRYICGSSKCDWQRAKSAIVRFLVAHYFSVQTKKKCSFWMSRYICIYIYLWANDYANIRYNSKKETPCQGITDSPSAIKHMSAWPRMTKNHPDGMCDWQIGIYKYMTIYAESITSPTLRQFTMVFNPK